MILLGSNHNMLKNFTSGLERNEYYITVEPIGTMLRNSRGIVPRNNIVMDTLWGIAGTASPLQVSSLRKAHAHISSRSASPYGVRSRRTHSYGRKGLLCAPRARCPSSCEQ